MMLFDAMSGVGVSPNILHFNHSVQKTISIKTIQKKDEKWVKAGQSWANTCSVSQVFSYQRLIIIERFTEQALPNTYHIRR